MQRHEELTLEDLYAKATEIREQRAALKVELKTYLDEIARRDAEIALASRVGGDNGQVIQMGTPCRHTAVVITDGSGSCRDCGIGIEIETA